MAEEVERAVVVLPRPNAQVERFRRAFDPLGDAIPAHITLVYPTLLDLDAARAAMTRTARRRLPFEYVFSEPEAVEDEYLFLLAERGGEDIRVLHEDLYRRLGRRLPDVFAPHVTIARTADAGRLNAARSAALAEGLRLAGTATALCLYRVDGAVPLVRELVVPFTGRR